MKKTIAILLVLVIGMAGVFAAEAQLDLTTTVDEFTSIYVSNASGTSPANYAAFMALVTEAGVAASAFDLIADTQTVGKLHFMTNAAIGTSVEMSATLLEGVIEDNNDTIGYSVDVNNVSVEASDGAATISDPIPLVGVLGDFTISSHNIDITLVQEDYENAPADTYNASIYFNFVTI